LRILFAVIMEVILSSETLAFTRATWFHIQEEVIFIVKSVKTSNLTIKHTICIFLDWPRNAMLWKGVTSTRILQKHSLHLVHISLY
jgi:hypothetical protein